MQTYFLNVLLFIQIELTSCFGGVTVRFATFFNLSVAMHMTAHNARVTH